MRIREKTITAACRTEDGIEWTAVKVRQDEVEPLSSGSQPWLPGEGEDGEPLESMQLPEKLSDQLTGDITVALRTSDLLLRTMRFPTADPDEIAGMVEFQVDKVSPFSVDQLAIAHEILSLGEDHAMVLMAAARREAVDAIGDSFEAQGVRIHSMDVRILGWLQLLQEQEAVPTEGCGILVVQDAFDFCLVITLNGLPLAFRILHADLEDMQVVDALIHEIGHALTTLDLEHDMPDPESIAFWTERSVPSPLAAKLGEKSGLKIECRDLADLPVLSEGVLRRTLTLKKARIELIPREWIEHEQRQILKRRYSKIAGGMAAVWLVLLLIATGIYQVRAQKLNRVQKQADAVRPAAEDALDNRKKLQRLQEYQDRSDSALECMREVTRLLPVGDIEFVSFSYSKGSGVTLRGTASSDDMVYDFWKTLAASDLFLRLRDQRVENKTTRGQRRSVFSVTLELPSDQEEDA